MIVGIGIDTTLVSRFSKLTSKVRFINRILTLKEIEDFNNTPEIKKANFLAKRFSGKEAFAKAIGSGIGQYCSFLDIEILKNDLNSPFVNYTGKKFANIFKAGFISFSDEVIKDDILISSVVVLEK